VAFAHAAMFSLALSALAEGLWCGYLPEFAGLTLDQLQQHPPKSIAMIKGHLDQDQKIYGPHKQQPHVQQARRMKVSLLCHPPMIAPMPVMWH